MIEKYLSWDVGIANLSYCLIEKNIETFKIRKWGIINLKEEIPLCNSHIGCTQKAINYHQVNDKYIYYCKTHSKKYVMEKVKILPCNDTDKCIHMINSKNGIHKCNNKAISLIELDKSEPYCKIHLDIHVNNIIKERSLKKIININANNISLQTLAVKLFCILDKIPEFIDVKEVLIENQPVLKNPTMKSISSLLFSYFTIRGIIDNNKILNVKFINASGKLKLSSDADKLLKKIKINGNPKEVYQTTKRLGIKFCKELIKDDKENLEFINKQNKQDDLCDSFLQGYRYIFCKNGIPKQIQDMLNKLVMIEDKSHDDNNKNIIDLSNLDVI